MGEFFSANSLGVSAHGFIGQRVKAAAGPAPASFSLKVGGPNSTGPLNPKLTGDGSGFNTHSFGTGGQMGTLSGWNGTTGAPGPAIGSFTIPAMGWQGVSGGIFFVAIQGTLAQSAFAQIALGAPANLTFLSSAATFSTTMFPGFSVWYWSDTHEYSFITQTIPGTIS